MMRSFPELFDRCPTVKIEVPREIRVETTRRVVSTLSGKREIDDLCAIHTLQIRSPIEPRRLR